MNEEPFFDLAEYARQLVSSWPPPTPEQVKRVSELLRPAAPS